MTRITVGLVVILALGLLGRAPAATAPPPKRVPMIGVLLSFSPPAEPEWKQHSVFLQELRTLGWREGENITIEYRWASGRLQRGADGGVVDVSPTLSVSPRAPRMTAQRVARFDPSHTRNCLPSKK